MLAACRNDQDDLLNEVLEGSDINVNFSDAIGDTALHYAQVIFFSFLEIYMHPL